MRIGMHKLADPDDPAMLGHDLGDPLVVAQNVQPGEDRQMLHKLAVLGNRVRQWNAMFEMCKFIVLDTMSRRDVDKACPLIGGHIVGKKHRHVMLITMAIHRVLRDRSLDVGALQCRQRFGAGDTDGASDLAHELGGKADHIALTRQRTLFKRGDPEHRIIDVRATGHGPVAWHRPWRGGPDDDIRALKGRMAWRLHREAGIDRDRGMVLIFDLGLGKRGLFDRRPHHRLCATIKASVHEQAAKLAGNRRLGLKSHCGVGVMPVAKNTKTLEFLGLHVEPVRREIPAFLTEFTDRHLVLVLALLAVLFLDLPFDRKSVAVPAGHVVGVLAQHRLRTVDNILENLVQRMSDMKLAICVGRSVMKDKQFGIRARLAKTAVDVHLLPTRKDLGLLLGQPATHREIGSRKEHRFFVTHRKISRFISSARPADAGFLGQAVCRMGGRIARASRASFAICAVNSSIPVNLRSARRNALRHTATRFP